MSVTAAVMNSTTYQLTATARFSDNTTRDVTSSAQFESANTSIAIVAPGGRVSVVSSGDVEVRAVYHAVAGAVRIMAIRPPMVTLRGTVREVQPTEHPIAGARIEIVGGPDAGRFVMSDEGGGYRFTGLTAGNISIVATRERYQPWRVENRTVTADTEEDVWFVLIPPTNDKGESPTARCQDGSWTWSTIRASACAANGGISYFVCPGPFCKDLTASRLLP